MNQDEINALRQIGIHIGPEEGRMNEDRTEDLRDWWMDQSTREANAVVPKAIEYGAGDLHIMGHAMVQMLAAGKADGQLEIELPDAGYRTQAFGMEMAVAFYVLGKVARLISAFQEGRLPSEDTWLDIGIYARMAQYIRANGRWP